MANKDFEIKSSEIRQLLNTPPSWMARWGTVFMLLALVAIVGVSYSLKFPEIITADVTISTANPPIPVVAKTAGVLSKIFIEEGQSVLKGEAIALSSNDAIYEDITTLEEKLELFNPNNSSTYEVFYNYPKESEEALILGEIQNEFDYLISDLSDYYIVSQNPEKGLTEVRINERIKSNKRSIIAEKKKLPTVERAIEIHRKLVASKQNEYQKKKITLGQLQEFISERDLLELEKMKIKTNISERELEIANLNRQLKAIKTTNNYGSQISFGKITETYKNLTNAVENWKRKNLITAPASGVISFYDKQADRNKYYKPEEEILAILSNQSDLLEGTVELPVRHIGRIQEGQQVFIKLHSFPYQEFGKVTGTVKYKSKVPKKGIHIIGVELSNYLTTTFGKQIPEEQELVGVADIITEDKSLFQTVFN